jgi:cell division protein DivIC
MNIKLISKLPSWLKSKYLLTALAFVVWMSFFDRNDIGLQAKRVNELRRLRKSENVLDKQISQAKEELNLLRTNPSTLEKYAREKYMMKRDNEDLYIITKK